MGKDSEVAIRIVNNSDYENMVRFFKENNLPEVTRHFHPFYLNSQTAYFIANTDHLDRYYVAIINSEIIGFCMLRGWEEGFVIPSFGILIDHRFRSMGFGRRMTEYTIEAAQRLNCPGLRLSVYQSNYPAIRLYETLGFREIGRESVVVAGELDTKIVMFRDIR